MTTTLSQHSTSATNLVQMGTDEFVAIAAYAKSAFGLNLPLAKKEMVFARLIKRLRQTGAPNFSSYLSFVQRTENVVERSEFLSSLTTNVTHFFRENHHFDFLKEKLLPELIERARAGQRVRIWSAGCSAGQEPYSLAMTILGSCAIAADLNIKILATDIDPRILEIAQAGLYPKEQCDAIPEHLRKFIGPAAQDQMFSISEAVRKLVSFAELNLIEDWPMQHGFDAIFCRNVAIYFDAPTQSRLWDRFTCKLCNGGHLFIGHSERLSGPALAKMRSVGVTVYAQQLSHQ